MSKSKFWIGLGILTVEVLAVLIYLIATSQIDWGKVALVILGIGLFLINLLAFILLLSDHVDDVGKV